jgi:serine/threonine protein kinase
MLMPPAADQYLHTPPSIRRMSQLIHFREGDDLFIQDVADLPFKLLGNLGSGHSGIVEKVEDMTTGAVFARKTIYIRGKRDKIATQNIFRNEIGIIRGLSKHHHMIRVFATYMAKREVGLLLQPVADGGDLAQFLEQVEEIRLADTSDVRLVSYMAVLDRAFGCLASGLAFMHQQKIRHKDIKPQNILVHEGSVIYTDFGYSLDSAHLSRSTTEGQPDALTRRYSAPEVLERGERNSSSDVFSLGCVYLELLAIKSGKPFFVPHEKTFAEDMEHIHGRLRSAETETHLSLLYQTTVSMTVARRKDRATASHVLEALSGTPRYCCATCRAMESTSKTVQSAHTEILNVKTRTMRPNAPTKRHSIATSTSPSEQFSNNGTERSRSGTRPPRAILRSQSHDPSGTHIRSIWSDQYNQMYREKHDNSMFIAKALPCNLHMLTVRRFGLGILRLGYIRPAKHAHSIWPREWPFLRPSTLR